MLQILPLFALVFIPLGFVFAGNNNSGNDNLLYPVLGLALQIITLAVIVSLIYRLWTTSSNFGAMVSEAQKIIGFGILFLAFDTIDKIIERVFGFGTESLFEPRVHNIIHYSVILLGFLLLSWGATKIIGVRKTGV